MKTGSLLLALLLAGSTLGAQERATIPAPRADSAHLTPSKALDSAASFANQVTTGELHQGAEPAEAGEHHVAGCEQFAPGDYITPHISDSHCMELPSSWKIWELHEV